MNSMYHLLRNGIVQAPMAGVQDATLAAAVYNAGGLGSIPCALLSVEQIRHQVGAFKLATTGAEPMIMPSHHLVHVNLNFFAHVQEPPPDAAKQRVWQAKLKPYFDELGVRDVDAFVKSRGAAPQRRTFNAEHLALVLELRPAVVSFHFGLPADLDMVRQMQHHGISVWSTATTVSEAVWLDTVGKVDAIICQGSEAGGHRGMFLQPTSIESQRPLRELLPLVHLAVHHRIPVIAAGCCAEEPDLGEWFKLGASAIQVGTCFLLTKECGLLVSEVHRRALLELEETVITNVFTGKPARGLVTRLVQEIGPVCDCTPGFPYPSHLVSLLRSEAEKKALSTPWDFTPAWRGQQWTYKYDHWEAGYVVKMLAGRMPHRHHHHHQAKL